MKYESNILERLIKTYGVVGNPKYVSEIIKQFIIQGKECYPNLFTYQSDWLAHIDEFGLANDYVVTYTGQRFYAPNTKESPVKRAILKGSTKYRDIDTGEVLDAFEDGRNLELVSVKMPVLKATGKNLFDVKDKVRSGEYFYQSPYIYVPLDKGVINSVNTTTISVEGTNATGLYCLLTVRPYYSATYEPIVINAYGEFSHSNHITPQSFIHDVAIEQQYYLSFCCVDGTETDVKNYLLSSDINIQLEEGSIATSYEPYKSNILTVNEGVTIRSNGDICDELNLLTGQLTQRIGEDGVVLSQEVVKTVDLNIKDQDNQVINQLTTFEGGTHFNTSSQTGTPLPTLEVDVVVDLEETLKTCSLEGNTM